jgi:lipopolysaccharide/colanic/teichoic acid biosynthesis glycosyltransferase
MPIARSTSVPIIHATTNKEIPTSTPSKIPFYPFPASAYRSPRTGKLLLLGFTPEPVMEPTAPLRRYLGQRLLDTAGACALLALAAPLLLVIGFLVQLDSPGPMIDAQPRIGRDRRQAQRRADVIPVRADLRKRERRTQSGDGAPFLLYRFRTRRAAAPADGPPAWSANAPRLTRVGRHLCTLGLDQLPQLWNVLRGDLSLVGRPTQRPHFAGLFAGIPLNPRRLNAAPPIALTPIQPRSASRDKTVKSNLALDLAYVRVSSLRNHLRILFKTILLVLTGKEGP